MNIHNGVMLNAYPDSIGNNLKDAVTVLQMPEFNGVFSLFYILPTFFNSDLDRGFSIIDYNLNADLVTENDVENLKKLGILLKFDIVLNHLSVASPQFKDLLKNGDNSRFKDFFINWNDFWQGNGTPNADGIIIPKKEYLDKLFMRKSGLPILNVRFPDGTERPYWNTFYQKITIENDEKTYLGQMDVNAKSELVWDFYENVLKTLANYGCKIVRLDAFAYLHKAVGESNFFNNPGTWQYLERVNDIAKRNNLLLLPEIHAEYGAHLHTQVADKGYVIYDFFLPALTLHAIEKSTNHALIKWANDMIDKKLTTVNMLGCHDGIPVLDLKGKNMGGVWHEGLLNDDEIEGLMATILERGGRVKNLYDADGKKISYYQINATYFSALGESDAKLLLARAIQLFMPGIPQIWYLDIFAGKNNYEAAAQAGADGHKEINRTNLSLNDIKNGLKTPVVQHQLAMMRLRNTCAAFGGTIKITDTEPHLLDILWQNNSDYAHLIAHLTTYNFDIKYTEKGKEKHINL